MTRMIEREAIPPITNVRGCTGVPTTMFGVHCRFSSWNFDVSRNHNTPVPQWFSQSFRSSSRWLNRQACWGSLSNSSSSTENVRWSDAFWGVNSNPPRTNDSLELRSVYRDSDNKIVGVFSQSGRIDKWIVAQSALKFRALWLVCCLYLTISLFEHEETYEWGVSLAYSGGGGDCFALFTSKKTSYWMAYSTTTCSQLVDFVPSTCSARYDFVPTADFMWKTADCTCKSMRWVLISLS